MSVSLHLSSRRSLKPAVRELSPRCSLKSSVKERRSSLAVEIQQVLDSNGVALLPEKALTAVQQVGKGRFKKVCKGVLRRQCGGQPSDVVVLQYKKVSSEVSELSLLAFLAGKARGTSHVPEVFGAVDHGSLISIVQEQAAFGTLKAALQRPELASQFSAQHRLNAAMKVALALEFLQSLRIVHADLSCSNLLLFHLNQDPNTVCVKITNFDLALLIAEGCTRELKKQPQATRWCSPETVASNKYSFKSDIWSLGVCFWELFSDGAIPWTRFTKRSDVTAMLVELSRHPDTAASMSAVSIDFPLPDTCSWDAYEIILACMRIDENSRLTAGQAADAFNGLVQADFSHSEMSRSSSMSDLSSCLDDFGTSLSTEASRVPDEHDTMKLVHTLSCKLIETTKDDSSSQQEKGEASTSKLKVVGDFLSSPSALSLLGNKRVQSMQQEVVQALRRAPSKPDYFKEPAELLAVHDVLHHTSELQISNRSWSSPAYLSIWTLWSLAENNVYRRQEFATEAAARAAFKSGHWSGVLKGPDTDEVYSDDHVPK